MPTAFKFIISVLIVVLITVLPQIYRTATVNRLNSMLSSRAFDRYFRQTGKPLTRLFFGAFGCEYLRLNGLIQQGNKKAINEQYEKLLEMELHSVNQEKTLIVSAFSYYLNNRDAKRTTTLLPRLKEAVSPEEYQRYEMIYAVQIRKESKYIAEMETQLDTATLLDQSILHYLISLQYGYQKNKEKEQEHLRLARKCSDVALSE